MEGLLTLQPTEQVVGKKSEYSTREEFAKAIKDEYDEDFDAEYIGTAYMRYFPKGTEESEFEFGKGVGIYQCVDKLTRGAFEVWTT